MPSMAFSATFVELLDVALAVVPGWSDRFCSPGGIGNPPLTVTVTVWLLLAVAKAAGGGPRPRTVVPTASGSTVTFRIPTLGSKTCNGVGTAATDGSELVTVTVTESPPRIA